MQQTIQSNRENTNLGSIRIDNQIVFAYLEFVGLEGYFGRGIQYILEKELSLGCRDFPVSYWDASGVLPPGFRCPLPFLVGG